MKPIFDRKDEDYVFSPKEMQHLVNVIFEMCYRSAEYYQNKDHCADRDKHMEWVAEQLRFYGLNTHPVGVSWGALKR